MSRDATVDIGADLDLSAAIGARLEQLVERLRPIELDDLVESAELLNRVDRKYLVDLATLTQVLDELGPDTEVLTIDGRRVFGYHSVYADTPDHESHLAAARRRPTRAKVRTRTYVDTGTSFIEVKVRDRLGRTTKHRRERSLDGEHLDADDMAFVRSIDAAEPLTDRLRPMISTSYRRASLLHGDQRMTIDVGLVCRAPDGRGVTLGDWVIVETKSPGHRPGPVDRTLWAHGVRTRPLSKYAIGAAALYDLPGNRWSRVLREVHPI